MTASTTDTLLNGRLHIRQPRSGYRFSMDSVLIARQVSVNSGGRVLDLGTGCGVISLILASRFPDITVYGVEIQESQATVAGLNVRENNLQDRVTILHEDIKTLSVKQTAGPVDVVVCNPPHIEKSCGRINPDPHLAVSRHEVELTLDDLVRCAKTMLKPFGRLAVIYPAHRLVDLTSRMRDYGMEPKSLRMIHTKEGENARRILVEAVKGANSGMTIHPPLIIHHADGTQTDDAQLIFSG